MQTPWYITNVYVHAHPKPTVQSVKDGPMGTDGALMINTPLLREKEREREREGERGERKIQKMCGTQPVFMNFKNMPEVRLHVRV